MAKTSTETPPIERLEVDPATLGNALLGVAHAFPVGVSVETRAQLDADLDPARVKQVRGKDYLATHDVIRTANRIFGYGQWGHEVVALELVGSAPMKNSNGEDGWYTGYRCTVRLTVAGCQPVCGVGYGDAFEKQWSAQITTHELAAKEAESDALKRAFKNFGDQFGLILYAKDDEKRRIAAEKAEAEANAPADEADVNELHRIAEAIGKKDVVLAAVAREVAEHGHVRAGWLARQLARMQELAANGDTTESDGDGTSNATDVADQGEAKRALDENDRPATSDEIAQVLDIASKKGAGVLLQTETAISTHRSKMAGDVVSARWLGKLTAKVLALPEEKTGGETKTQFEIPESARAEATADDVEAAFGEAA